MQGREQTFMMAAVVAFGRFGPLIGAAPAIAFSPSFRTNDRRARLLSFPSGSGRIPVP